MNMYSYSELLKKFYDSYGVDSESLSRLTNIPAEIIDHDPEDFTPELKEKHSQEYSHLWAAFAFLSESAQIDEDAYVRGHIKNLIEGYGFSVQGISRFIGLKEKTLRDFLSGEKEVDLATRYRIAVRFLSMEWLLTKNPFADL